MSKLIQSEKNLSEKYELKRDDSDERLVALTPDNVARVEAMIRNDSAYLRAAKSENAPKTKKTRKDDKPNGIKKGDVLLDGIGSSAFWMGLLKSAADKGLGIDSTDGVKGVDGRAYSLREIIAGAIAAIDGENSTHQNTNGVGRMRAWVSICDFIRDNGMNGLLKCLRKKSFDLFDKIDAPENAPPCPLPKRIRRNKSERKAFVNNPWLFDAIKASENDSEFQSHGSASFASKFCHYAAFYIFQGEEAQDNFPIFDGVLQEALPKYLERYGLPAEGLDDYRSFCDAIDNLRDKAEITYGARISRNGVDHLLWYFHKGRLDELKEKKAGRCG